MNHYRIIWLDLSETIADVFAPSPEAACNGFADSDPRLRQTIAASGMTASAWLADKVRVVLIGPVGPVAVSKGGEA